MDFPWRNKKVLIFGLGLLGGGVGAAKFFAANGAKVAVTDLKPATELKDSIAKLRKYDIKFVLGGHRKEDFKKVDLIVKNPAVPNDSPYLAVAKKFGVPIEMESSLFFRLTPSKNIIGVTGTKGKTTTTLLIGKILKEAKFNVAVAGNLRISMLQLLPKITQKTWVVLELSSWQLEGLLPCKMSPRVAVLTNIMPDHLNRYSKFEDYVEAKKIIFKFQKKNDIFVTSAEQQLTKQLAKEAKSQVVFFSKQTLSKSFLKVVRLSGEHNLLNVSCAYVVVKTLGVKDSIILSVLRKFSSIPDRLERISEVSGVNFTNDTTATTPEATIAAISSFSAPIILICGGADKNLEFSRLAKTINKRVKGVVLLEGSATDKIEKEVKKEKIFGRFSNFKRALEKAVKHAEKGDIVLLSPAAASFGMFKNEFDRGEQFKKIVRGLEVREW